MFEMDHLFLVTLISILNPLLCSGLPPAWPAEYAEEPIYPFQQYIQVRKSYSVQHLPVEHGENIQSETYPAGENLQSSATDHDKSGGVSANYADHSNYHSHRPKLREAIETFGKQEVYEEKGYTDSDYDHYNHGSNHDGQGDHYPQSQSTNVFPRYETLAEKDGTSTKVLEYAANRLYDADAHQRGIYKAREGIYCPPVIDFDMSSKSMKMGKGYERPPGKPRLSGLGSKIRCLRRKYFGENPFPSAIFKHPHDPNKSTINSGSMEEYLADFKKNIHS